MAIDPTVKSIPKSPELSQTKEAFRETVQKGRLLLDRFLNPGVVRHLEKGEAQGRGPAATLARVIYNIAVRMGKAGEAVSLLERALHGHFADGKPLGLLLPKGEFRFRKKTEEQQGFFFKNSLPFTQEKKGNLNEVRRVLFRDTMSEAAVPLRRYGFLKETKNGQKDGKILVCDLQFQSGQERFARIPLGSISPMSQMMVRLASFIPGSFVEKVLLQQWVGGNDFNYLALSHKIVRPDLALVFKSPMTESAQERAGGIQYGREASQGIALSARTEQMVAQQLDLNLRAPSFPPSPDAIANSLSRPSFAKATAGKQGERAKKRKGEKETEEYPVFVPWYQLVWRPRKWKGKIRWWVPLLYFVAASILGLGSYFVFKFLLQ